LGISDGTGGSFRGAVEPGHYKLAISYRPRVEGFLFDLGVKEFGVTPSSVWQGWQMSNWIDIRIEAVPGKPE
jgi:hypothetical protein